VLKLSVHKLDNVRCDAIRTLLDGIRNLLNQLLEGPAGCDGLCKAQDLGVLLRQLKAYDILSATFLVPSRSPFIGLRYHSLKDAVDRVSMTHIATTWGDDICLDGRYFLGIIRQQAGACLELKPSDFGFSVS